MLNSQFFLRPANLMQRIAHRVAASELVLLAVMAPLLLFPTRWTPLAAAVIVFIWLCRWVATGRPGVGAAVDAPVTLLLVMAGVGFYVSPDRAVSVPALWRLVLGVALFYGLAHGLRTESRRRWLPAALIVASLALALLTLLGTGWARVRLFNLPQVYGRLPAWLRDVQDQNPFHPRVMGMALATWLPLPLALLVFGRQARQRFWAGVAVVVLGVTLLLSQSLQALVGLACAVLLLGVCGSRWFLTSVPAVLAALLLAAGRLHWRSLAVRALSVDDPLGIAAALRLDMWSRAVAMIRDMPYTGIGLDMFPTVQWHFYPGVMLGTEPHAHNLFLQVALDLGLPGLLAFLWLLLSVGYVAVRAYRRSADAQVRAVLLGALAAGVSYAASGLLDTIWAAKAAPVLWVGLGLAAGLSTELSTDRKRTNGWEAQELQPRSPLYGGNVAVQPSADSERGNGGGGTSHPFVRFAAGHPFTVPLLLVLVLLLLPGLVLPRGAWALNEKLIRAHRVLLAAGRGDIVNRQELVAVRGDLRSLAQGGARRASLYSLLAQAEGWLGENGAALAAFAARVELDGQDPIASYAPFEGLRRWLAGEPRRDHWEDAAWFYGYWMARFPQRAEAYVLLALVRERQGKPQAAAQVLRSALQNGAQPQSVLAYALAQLTTGTP